MTTLLGDVHVPVQSVDAPPATPPLVSLLTSAIVSEGDGDWQYGIAYLSECTAQPADHTWWQCVGSEGAVPAHTKDVGANVEVSVFQPFGIFDGVACTTMQPGVDWQARARRALLARQSQYIEFEMWGGAVATAAAFPNTTLVADATIVGGGALGLRRSLAELEQAVADNYDGRPAMIHAQPRLVELWQGLGLASPNASGRQLRTALGTLVVPEAGATGAGPNLAGGGTVASSYAYVTGIVSVWLGTIRDLNLEGLGTTAAGSYDPDVNDAIFRAEREVLYAFDPCLVHGVEVTHSTEL